MRARGEITVFLAMILLSMCAVLCAAAESVRTAGARCYLRTAVDASMDSLMAQYHRGLWEKYRIFGLEHRGRESLERELAGFLTPYLTAQNWYPMEVSQVRNRDVVGLTEGGGRYMEQEILDYMKYGLIGVLWDAMDEEGAGELLAVLKEGEGIGRISDLYEGHAKEAVRLEEALERIETRLASQRENWEEAKAELDNLDGDSFVKKAEAVIRDLEKIPGLVENYERQADRLGESLAASRRRFEGEEDLGTQVRQALEEEIRQYEAYVDADGERRQEVVSLTEKSKSNIEAVNRVIREAEEVMDYIDSWEPEDEDDELDEEALWKPVREAWGRYPILSLQLTFGVQDKETEGILERISRFMEEGLLGLVLPEGTVVSSAVFDLAGLPSAGQTGAESRREQGTAGVGNLLDRLIVCEYAVRYFHPFDKENAGSASYELEYILCGDAQERENLSGTVTRLVMLRSGLNLAHILTDAGKRQEARSLAAAIVGGTGILPLVSVMAFFVMTQWALGEAIVDVKCLLNGEKIPLIKSASQWQLDLDGLLHMGREGSISREAAGTEGLDYCGYLRILLFAAYGEEEIYRMMDVMQMNIGKEQTGFSLADCACAVDMEASVWGKHVFFSLGLWKNGVPGGYETAMEVSGSYMEGDL